MRKLLSRFLHSFLRLWPLALGIAILVACGSPQSQMSQEPIKIDGSSTVFPITNAVVAAFQETPKGENVTIEVQFSGTSAGFRQFCAGDTTISNASRPILIAEMNTCISNGVPFIELPVGFDALTVAVNPANTWVDQLSVAELKMIWEKAAEGKITRWNQIRPSFPDQPLVLYGPGGDSGTFDYFNEAIMGDAKNSRTDYTGSEDDDVIVNGIAENPNALGYLPFAFFEANRGRLKPIPIDNGKGAILPSPESVQNAQYQPLSRPLFIYVNAKAAQDHESLKEFVEFYLKEAANSVAKVGYVPLPEEAYQLAELQFIRGEVGTAFNGAPEPDITITEILRRQTLFQAQGS
ncbi:PstS family phosphate ABC transporter substrate-binding protein [Thermosynechococcaceae cyanobacterium BACA0444]|uniref:Phosphate-binding protein n=1 Tax=Pseudocalidococcus azoricus BACA0444 TaxID=2918990 RepID=A0AAE4JYS8_9CYAN|nr:PstS family phosphate ABC transporter substrate-binding protein [Pseudocalidococcus azoricus]MDS3860067.1 PstS family phosphate ABC transporter substrate-binding protein [Pseudocalidococcus azoricus BACA0444]